MDLESQSDIGGHDRIGLAIGHVGRTACRRSLTPAALPAMTRTPVAAGTLFVRFFAVFIACDVFLARNRLLVRSAVSGQFRRGNDAGMIQIHRRKLPAGIHHELVRINAAIMVPIDAIEPSREGVRTDGMSEGAAAEWLAVRAVKDTGVFRSLGTTAVMTTSDQSDRQEERRHARRDSKARGISPDLRR